MAKLHIVLIPLLAHGHMIPMLDIAKLFISRGLKTTIITTPAFADPIKRAQKSGHGINLDILKFPPEGSTLPDHLVSVDQLIAYPDMMLMFDVALNLLQEPAEKLLEELNPDCLVSDVFLPWTAQSAAKLGIPRLVFHGTSYFGLCSTEAMRIYKPFKNVLSDTEPFVLPSLPHEVEYVRTQVSEDEREGEKNEFCVDLMKKARESVKRSYGVLVNSFYELESDYADHFKNLFGMKAWHIGPLLLSRGAESSFDENECLTWLDSKNPNSVVYVCFGSMVTFTSVQLREIAIGLEESGKDFIWVVRNGGENEEWLPKGFEERLEGKGMIIRGWAPQVMILNHSSIGAFVTHCGWNSILESVCAGVPMVTWPVFAEQFFNEKLVTEVLGIGVSVGNKMYQRVGSEGVERGAVTRTVRRAMIGDEATKMRNKVNKYKEMARKAVEECGSSYNNVDGLIKELSICRFSR